MRYFKPFWLEIIFRGIAQLVIRIYVHILTHIVQLDVFLFHLFGLCGLD